MGDATTVAESIRATVTAAMDARGWSPNQLADASEVHWYTVAGFLDGRRQTRLDKVCRMLAALDLTIDIRER